MRIDRDPPGVESGDRPKSRSTRRLELPIMRARVVLAGWFTVAAVSQAQPAVAKSLRARLLQATARCRASLGAADANTRQVVDLRNRFAHISGEAPPCGCPCVETAAAFRTARGTHRLLSYYEQRCAYRSEIPGPDWGDVLPHDVAARFGAGIARYRGDAVFFVRPQLPRRGTRVKLRLELLPLGFSARCPSGICWARSEQAARIVELAPGSPALRRQAARRYAHYRRVSFGALVLRWDRRRGRLLVVRRVPMKARSLREFVDACGVWKAAC